VAAAARHRPLALATGYLTEYPVASPYNDLNDIALGPDGALWFTGQNGTLVRITPSGAITKVQIPTPNSKPNGLVAGPNHTIWFAETGADRVGYITV
jgi:virginiamycin B lyase